VRVLLWWPVSARMLWHGGGGNVLCRFDVRVMGWLGWMFGVAGADGDCLVVL